MRSKRLRLKLPLDGLGIRFVDQSRFLVLNVDFFDLLFMQMAVPDPKKLPN